ncbi:DUF6414 family protein [Nosocomiicoccus ampullae]|uniref:DUF6414 family protein n=1 Tax=Nosocomiicoccus ampullae TaxID=489910 RepID=UPI00254E55EF|nr:DUF6414 family protein [Nosocomiicoccus ampullae]MDK6862961.1 DUF6414 family protein [Nosocomiicoccus ampullae]
MNEIHFPYSKIIIFDEKSASDILDQSNDGRLKQIERITNNKELGLLGELTSKLSKGDNSLSNQLTANWDIGKNIQIEITNTIQSEFIKKIENNITNFNLEYIQDYKLDILEDTTTYLKAILPILKMVKDKSYLGISEAEAFEFNNLEEALDDMKTYHEFIARKGNSIKVIRINANHLKGDYKLADLRLMKLNIVGVNIGRSKIKNLLFDNYFEPHEALENESDSLTDEEIDKQFEETETIVNHEDSEGEHLLHSKELEKEVDIIDVIIAGVK